MNCAWPPHVAPVPVVRKTPWRGPARTSGLHRSLLRHSASRSFIARPRLRLDTVRQPFFEPRPIGSVTHPPAQTTGRAPADASRESWSSAQLLAGRNEVSITHGGNTYRLRLTSLGKLILTK